MSRRLARALATLAPLLLAGCAYAHQQAVPYRPAGGLSSPDTALPNGVATYQRDCAWCHGNAGQGTANGPSLVGGSNGEALTDLMLRTGRMPIDSPVQKDALHQAPIYDDRQIAAIVGFVRTFGASGPAIPTVDLARGSLTEGLQLYQADCAACHSVTGEGGVLGTGKAAVINGFTVARQGLVAPSLLRSSPLEVAEAIRTGPPGMPVFGPAVLTDDQVDAVTRYVAYLQTAPDRGGLGLGRIGPVAEGAVAWVVGLGVLLLLVRWIGTSMHSRPHHHGDGGQP